MTAEAIKCSLVFVFSIVNTKYDAYDPVTTRNRIAGHDRISLQPTPLFGFARISQILKLVEADIRGRLLPGLEEGDPRRERRACTSNRPQRGVVGVEPGARSGVTAAMGMSVMLGPEDWAPASATGVVGAGVVLLMVGASPLPPRMLSQFTPSPV